MRSLVFCLFGAAAFVLTSCQNSSGNLRKAARDLDAVEDQITKWGKTTVSEIVLVKNEGQFKIDYATNVAFYVNAARNQLQGAARSDVETAFGILTSLKATLTPPISAGQAGQAALPSLVTTNGTNTTAPLPSSTGNVSLATPTFTPSLQILTNTGYTISERQAMMIGMNDKIAEMLIKFLAHPEGLPTNRRVLLGVTQVSCEPGTITREGYIADVNVALYFMDDQGNSSADQNSVLFPSAFAVLPLLDAQQLDLRSSQRNQLQLAADLAIAMYAQGATAQAGALMNYIKKKEADMISRTILPMAASYTDNGSFGFQIMPAFQAIGSPSKAYDKATDRLQATSFPVVVALLVDTNDLFQDNGGTKVAKWTNIRADVRWRWIPATKSRASLSNVERYNTGIRLDAVRERIKKGDGAAAAGSHAVGELKKSYEALWRYAMSTTYSYSLTDILADVYDPPNAPALLGVPTITNVTPTIAWINSPTVFTIEGTNFLDGKEAAVVAVMLNGKRCEVLHVGKKAVIAMAPEWPVDAATLSVPGTLTVVTKAGVARSANIRFAHRLAQTPPQKPDIRLTRDGNGNVTSLTVQDTGGLTAKELLEEIEDWLRPGKPD